MVLFYELKGKRYCIEVSKGFLTIHRNVSTEHESLPPLSYDMELDYQVLRNAYWDAAALHRFIERYETDCTVKALAPDMEQHLLAAAANAPEWALDLTDLEIAEAMRLRKLIELITGLETVDQVRVLLKSAKVSRGPAPLRGALVCIAILCSDYTHDRSAILGKIKGHAEDALRRVPRYMPGYSAS